MSVILAPVGGYLAGDQQALAAALRPRGPLAACAGCTASVLVCRAAAHPEWRLIVMGSILISVMKPQNTL